jgi:hypothetical protein
VAIEQLRAEGQMRRRGAYGARGRGRARTAWGMGSPLRSGAGERGVEEPTDCTGAGEQGRSLRTGAEEPGCWGAKARKDCMGDGEPAALGRRGVRNWKGA